MLLAQTKPTIEAKLTSIRPKIDGYLETTWFTGDSAKNFIQQRPDEGKLATESTTVYLLYDPENLYIAFKCYCRNLKEINRQVAPRDNTNGDRVGFIIDTFDDQNTAYYFLVNAAGVQADLYVSSDFRNWDYSWDGVWYSAARLTNFGYCVEIQIPFRSIRYRPDITEWGINFTRNIPKNDEQSYWSPQPRQGVRVSLSGRLFGISPKTKGANLEVYPVALCRYEQTDKIKIYPDAGLDVSWVLGSASTFQLTTNPDFAQIEADPTQINLSKYELWYPERRPFFVEDAQLFLLNGIETFYSRRIGKPLPTGKAVPIIAGAKFVAKLQRTDIGFIDAMCQKVNYEFDGVPYTEPLSYFRVLRLRRNILQNSSLGFLYSTKVNEDMTNSLYSLDGVFQHKDLQLYAQSVYSELESQSAFGVQKRALSQCYQMNYDGYKFGANAEFSYLPKDFSVDSIGFVARKGLFGHVGFIPKFYNFWQIRDLSANVSFDIRREAGEEVYAFGPGIGINVDYNNNWGNWFGFSYDRDFEMGSTYYFYAYDILFWSDVAKPLSVSAEAYGVTNSYNYRRGYFAPYSNLYSNLEWRINPSLKFGLQVNSTVEWDTVGKVVAIGWILHPTVNYALTKDLQIRLYSELDFDSKIHYLNLLLSWNFRPKSWFYLAFNESHDASQTNFPLIERIGVIKIRYLFFF